MSAPALSLTEKIEALFELYEEMGSELTETEHNFLKLLVTKAGKDGLDTDKLTPDELKQINFLIVKYSSATSFDSDEGPGGAGMG